MENKLKITKGEWIKQRKAFTNESGLHAIAVMNENASPIAFAIINRQSPNGFADANAQLIAEAGTVANECGLTPRQLLEQRNELLKALKKILDVADIPQRYMPYLDSLVNNGNS